MPTAWIMLVPFVGPIYWAWKYAEAVWIVTDGRFSVAWAFVLLCFTWGVGPFVLQGAFNQIEPVASPEPAMADDVGRLGDAS